MIEETNPVERRVEIKGRKARTRRGKEIMRACSRNNTRSHSVETGHLGECWEVNLEKLVETPCSA